MTDTQWPRYEVFIQEKPQQPFNSVGSVHAPDAEIALLNGRNVFVRRPQCYRLWVVPAQAIYAQTAQEIAANPPQADNTANPPQPYAVFRRNTHKRTMTYVTYMGDITANSPTDALQKAITQFDDGQTIVWWVCPVHAIKRSEEADSESWFSPALDKTYRMPNQYHTVFTMQKIKKGTQTDEHTTEPSH